ncbi:DUF3987 domain-containing protein [Celeribacter naphthalenivorans]|uniref:DUF3987 domain-containing protein n=1 Tax=Celeribacter naphthalenivorans TaxID=1614694 RepID=UPI001CFBCE4D|nr:DUF3987 domain-containing protein [Celeribacter naphthalenivorans]
MLPQETPFMGDWPVPSPRLTQGATLPAPELPLADVFGPLWADWISRAAEAKSAPPDYVVAGLLATVGSAIGNTRWAAPWEGWQEPPILWTISIGSPSSNKSPGLDAVLGLIKEVEREKRHAMEGDLAEWREKAEIAKLAESAWKEVAKAALKDGSEPPERPDTLRIEPEPFLPRFSIADGTVERLAVIVSKQPRGTLLARDELAGWLQGMTRYSGGGSDRPFWLEAYGGRAYSVERMGREPVHIDRLSIAVTGGIQPDRLKSLLLRSDDDGLLARFIPIWPDPVPLRRPRAQAGAERCAIALRRLYGLSMYRDENDRERPWVMPFSDPARDVLDAFRLSVRAWERDAEGLLLSFIGKMSGLAVRLSLILSYLDWAMSDEGEPQEIGRNAFGRAAHFVEFYALPMARRAYADAATSKAERGARRLLDAIRARGWPRFTSREALRLDLSGLSSAAQLNAALTVLEDGDAIRPIAPPPNPNGGRPTRLFAVNPALLAGMS